MTTLRTVGAINRLQPRITKKDAIGCVESRVNPVDYGVGAVVVDANGKAWQRDINNLADEALLLDRGLTWWWKVGSGEDSLTSKDIPLPATLMSPYPRIAVR